MIPMLKITLAARVVAGIVHFFSEDQKHRYGLQETHVTRIKAPGIGLYQFDNGQYKIESPNPDETILTAQPFPASSGLWDGPSMTWDMSLLDPTKPRKDGLFEASLDHDLSYAFAEQIAKANGVPVKEVYLWANRVLQFEMAYYAKVRVRAERSLVRRVLDALGGPYSILKAFLRRIAPALAAAACLGLATGCAGCFLADPEEGVEAQVEADPIVWTCPAPAEPAEMTDEEARHRLAAPGL